MAEIAQFTIEELIACQRREVNMRRSLYPKWVSMRRMSQHAAEVELAKAAAILEILEGMRANARDGQAQDALQMGPE